MFSPALYESPYRDKRPNESAAPLTTRELEIIKLVADGKKRSIGNRLKSRALRCSCVQTIWTLNQD